MSEKHDELTIYVSPDGDDSWSGTPAEPNSDRGDGPLATLHQAQKTARRIRAKQKEPPAVRIILRGGYHFLKSPLLLGAKDSGSAALDRRGRLTGPERPIVFCAHGGEKPVISGGTVLTGWRVESLYNKTMWVTSVPGAKSGRWNFRQLFVNGERRFRPRLPRNGYFRMEKVPGIAHNTSPYHTGGDTFIYAEGDMERWRALEDIDVVVMNFWSETRTQIKSLDERTRTVVLKKPSGFRMTDEHSLRFAQYYVENVLEVIERGEFYLDRRNGKLYYYPRRGERLESSEIIAPRIAQLVRVEGRRKQSVQHIRFEDLTFSHTEWRHPKGRASLGQAAVGVPGAVSLAHAHACSFSKCNFVHLGTYAVELEENCTDVRVSKCRMKSLGAGGIRIWHGCKRNTVADCDIGPLGHIYHSASGVVIGKSSGNKIIYNEIHHTGYTGISVGWTWGYRENDCYGNIVEHNHIHHIGQGMLSDMGGIYVLGHVQGMRVRFNVFHDIVSRGYGGWAIYTDEGATDILVESNLAYNARSLGFGAWGTAGKARKNEPSFDTRCAVFHQHYGRDNVIRNNIFAFGQDAQIALSRPEPHRSFEMVNNIFYFDTGVLFTGNWNGPDVLFERNLYFDARKRTKLFPGGLTLRQWQKKGMDMGSRVADPMFVAPQKGNFRLRKSSPAFALGFKEFDVSTVGPRD